VLDKYRKYSKLELVNQLNEYSFSIWLLDDGYFDPKKCLWELCSAMMNEQENIKTLNILHNKFEISGHIEHDKRYILFDVPSSRKINNIILHNIPNDLDVVKYKTLIKDVS
jgi:hypothetical protein